MMKRLTTILCFALTILLVSACNKKANEDDFKLSNQETETQLVEQLDTEEFIAKVCDINGNSFKYKGDKPCVIDFYATWCGPCVGEMDDLEALYQEMKDNENVEMIFVNLGEDRTIVEKFALDKNYTMPFYCDVDGKLGEENNITAIPQTYIYNKNQMPVDRYIGANPKDVYKNAIEAVLNK